MIGSGEKRKGGQKGLHFQDSMAKEVLLSEAPGGGGGFEAPPPPGGLGNFKGVMLCNRPSEVPMGGRGGGGDLEGAGDRPFKSTVSATYNEQIGLNPPAKKATAGSDGPPVLPVSEAMQRHSQWLKDLGQKVRSEKAAVAQSAETDEEKKKKFAEFCQRQRDCVKEVLMAQKAASGKNLAEEGQRSFEEVQELRAELTEAVKAKGNNQGGTKKSKNAKPKPLWAMTEEEKNQFEEEEAGDLIDFAENLDFDQFIHDLDFREAVCAIKDRAGKLQKEQDHFKARLVEEFNQLASGDEEGDQDGSIGDLDDGIEGTSVLDTSEGSPGHGRRRKRAPRSKLTEDGRPEWDVSTTADEDRQVDEKVRDVAERALEDRSMKQIHSKESVQKIIEKQKEKEQQERQKEEAKKALNLVALVEHLEAEGSAPNPVISVSGDVLGRANRPKDPSMLPYLYRSPAV